jgi:hypothetical protein
MLQKDRALRIKHIVSQSRLKKRKRILQDVRSDLDYLPNDKASASIDPSLSSSYGSFNGWNDSATQEDPYSKASETDLEFFIQPMWSTAFHDNTFTLESYFSQETNSSTSTATNIDSRQNQLSYGSSDRTSNSTHNSPSVYEDVVTVPPNVSPQGLRFETSREVLVTFSVPICSSSSHDGHFPGGSTTHSQVSLTSPQNYFSTLETARTLRALWPVQAGRCCVETHRIRYL